jgi:hypothetical protein
MMARKLRPAAPIATAINEAHQRAFGKAREALDHARHAGDLLHEAKASMQHGEWLPWLKENIKFSERTAQAYMRLAARWDELQKKSATAADLPLRDALKVLSAPTGPTTEVEAARVFTEQAVRRKAECRARVEGIDNLVSLAIDPDTVAWCVRELDSIIGELTELKLVSERHLERLRHDLLEHDVPEEIIDTFLDPGFSAWLAKEEHRNARRA